MYFQSGEKGNSGRFTLDESCNFLELVMNQQKTNNFESLDFKKIDYKAIGEALHRYYQLQWVNLANICWGKGLVILSKLFILGSVHIILLLLLSLAWKTS